MADSSDEFGLDSSDEADLLDAEALSSSQQGIKRKGDDELANDLKRSRGSAQPSQVSVDIARKVLKERFGMSAFRLKQEAAITRLLDGDSAVVVFPTGGGKSLCYQVPALCFKELDELAGIRQGPAEGGITLVVSPLIALMKDQCDALHRRGISAAVMDSTKTREEYFATCDAMRNGTLDILYCAPERLNNEGFVALMANVKGGVRLLAVDEAHCISEWGHAFRPDYLKVARFAKEIQAERVVCLTATATPHVAKDVCRAFDIPEDGLFRTTTYRPNLRLHAQSYQTKAQSYPKLRMFLKAHPGPTIIYVTLQKQAEELAQQLRQHKFKTEHFHAGMDAQEKFRVQDLFMQSNDIIIVATIAFGMGIDKANIRTVIHYDIPRSLEGYSQEIGRAGRDGLESQCMLYLCAEDFHLRESFARGDLPSKTSVTSLLRHIFSLRPSSDGLIEAAHYSQSRDFDIRPTTLAGIYAQLELTFGLLRATTPKYSKYSYKLKKSLDWDTSTAAVALRGASRKAKTDYHVDVDGASLRSGVSRADLVTKLNAWNEDQYIDLSYSNVLNVYRPTKGKVWPPPAAEQQHIIDALYEDLEKKEQQALDRMHEVMDLVTGEECFASGLAKHFGDTLPDNSDNCGNCTWCVTGTAVVKQLPPKRDWNSKAFFAVLEAVPERDDPRYLARIAFGISSPRITQAKLSRNAIFGSMEDHDFMTLLNAFAKICDKPSSQTVPSSSSRPSSLSQAARSRTPLQTLSSSYANSRASSSTSKPKSKSTKKRQWPREERPQDEYYRRQYYRRKAMGN